MSIEKKRGRKEKKRKTCFITWKSLFLFLLFYNYSFASAVQKQIEKLKLVLPQYFKSLEKNCEGSAKVFGDRLVLSDGLFCPISQLPRSMAALHFDKLKLMLSSGFFVMNFSRLVKNI